MVRKKSTDGGGESSEPGSGRGPPPSSERGGPLQQGSRGGGSQGGRGGGRQYEQGGRRGGYGGRGRGSTVAGSFLARSGITMVRKKSTDGGGESSEPGSGRGPPPSSERGGPLQQGSRGGGSQGGRGGGRQYEQGGRRGGYGGRGRGRGSTVAGSFLARSGITMVWKKRTDGGGESSEAGSGRGSPPSSERGGPPQQGSRGPLQQVSQEALQVLDLGRRQPIGHGLESWRGFDQNMSSTTFIEPLKVIDFVTQLLNRDVSSRPLSDADRVKIENSLRGLEVEVTNCGNMRPNYLPMEQYQQGGRGGGYGRCGRGGRGEDNENPSGESAGEDNENPSGESAHGTAIMGIRVTAHHTLVMAADGIGSIIEKGVINVLGDDYVKLHCIGGTLIYGEAGYSGFGRDSKRKLKVTSRSLKRTPKYLEEQVEEVYQTLQSLKSSYENNYRCLVGSVDEDGYPRLWVMTPLEKIPVLDDTWTIGCGASLANLEARLFSPDEHDVTDAFDICCRGIFRASIRNKAVGGKLLVATINVFYQITVYETNMKGLQNYFGLSDFQYKVLEQTEDLDWSRMPAFPAKTKEEKISFMESCRHDRKTQNFKKL